MASALVRGDAVQSVIGLLRDAYHRAAGGRKARAAQVQDVVTRTISGHLTEGMQRHYSTVSGDEQRQALAKVIDLTRAHAEREIRRTGGQQAAGGGQQKERPARLAPEPAFFPRFML